MANQTAVDAQGNVFEYKDGQWVKQSAVPGALESVAIGAGKSFFNVGRGIADLGASALQQITPSPGLSDFRNELKNENASDARLLSGLEENQPIATGIGQALPFLAAAPLAGASIPAQAGLGAVEGAVQFGTPEERLERGLIGGGLGAAGGLGLNLVQRVSQGIIGSAKNIAARRLANAQDSAGAARVNDSVVGAGSESKTRTILNNAGREVDGFGMQSEQGIELLKQGRELGILFEPGAKSGNIATKQFFESAKSSPLFSDIIQETITIKNRETYSKLVLRALGQKGKEFSNATLGNVENALSTVRDGIVKRNPVIRVDKKFTTSLDKITKEFETNPAILSDVDPVIRNIEKLKNIITKGDSVSSRQYIKLRSQMRRLQRKFSDDANSSTAVGETIDAMDDMFGRSVSVADRKAFDKTTQQFRLLQAIEKPGVVSGDKTIRPAALERNLKKIFKTEFSRNDKFGTLKDLPEFNDLFKATKVFNNFKNIINDSGTASRLSLKNILGDKVGTAAQLAFRPLLRKMIELAQPVF